METSPGTGVTGTKIGGDAGVRRGVGVDVVAGHEF